MMILYSASRSPYARKVHMAMLELDLIEQVEIRSVNPFDNQPDHLATNPLARVPALQLSDGTRLCDSRLILDYLDETYAAAPHARQRDWAQRNRIVLAEGVMDAAYGLVSEGRRPPEVQHEAAAWRLEDVLSRALLALEASSRELSAELAGRLEITLCCALGYMDFRLSAIAWRAICPTLANWHADFSQRPSALRTAPR